MFQPIIHGDINSVYLAGVPSITTPYADVLEQGLKLTKKDEELMSFIKLVSNKQGVEHIQNYYKEEGEKTLSGENEILSLQESDFRFMSLSLKIREQIFSLKLKYQDLCLVNDGINEEITKLNKLIENLMKQTEEYNRFIIMFQITNNKPTVQAEKTGFSVNDAVDKQIDDIRIILNKQEEKARDNEKQMCKIINIINTLKEIITISPEELVIIQEKEKKDPELATKAVCVICSSRSIEFCLSSCGHCFCGTCSDKIKENCHVCRRPKSKKIKLYYD